MSRRRAGRPGLPGLALVGAMAAVGCGSSDNHVPQTLTVQALWNDSPSAVDQIGYQLAVDLLWPDRQQGCYALSPNLAIQIDGDVLVAPPIEGDCRDESYFVVGGIAPQGATTVTLKDGDQVLGEGIFGGLFPGSGASVTTPAAGQPLTAGGPFAITLPVPSSLPSSAGARFYWTDPSAGVPPFYSFAMGTISTDGSTFQGTAPTTPTGQAVVVVESSFGSGPNLSATSCTGFKYCDGAPSTDVAGPVSIDVVP